MVVFPMLKDQEYPIMNDRGESGLHVQQGEGGDKATIMRAGRIFLIQKCIEKMQPAESKSSTLDNKNTSANKTTLPFMNISRILISERKNAN